MEVTRIFYPVGQGAFYGEHIECGKQSFNIVYDCGSQNVEALNQCIKTFHDNGGNGDIDILFVSHFHEDHINGILKLVKGENKHPVKRLVVPYMDPVQKMYYIGALSSENNTLEIAQFIMDPKSVCENVTTVEVAIENYNSETNDRESIDINDIGDSISSGSKIKVSQSDKDVTPIWMYMPMNVPMLKKDEKRMEKFGETLKNVLCVDSLGKVVINDIVISEVKGVYNNTFKRSLNETSMLVYSGCNIINIVHSHCCCNCMICNCCYFDCYPLYERDKCGCLYMGDIPLHSSKSNAGLIKKYYESVYNNISIIQVPHHGSQTSNDEYFWGSFRRCIAVVSFGINNTYGHPDSETLMQLRNDCLCVVPVTQYRCPFIQRVHVFE